MKKKPLSARTLVVTAVAVAAGISTIAVTASQLGYKLDSFIFRSEFVAQVQPLNAEYILQLKVQLFALEALRDQARSRNQAVSPRLIREISLVAEQLANAVSRDKDLRK